MKKIILIIFVLTSLISSAQLIPVDSTKVRVGKLNIQARDVEGLLTHWRSSDIYDELIDSVNAEFRKNPKPSNNDVVTVDSVTIEAMIGTTRYMRQESYEVVSPYYSRVDAAIKAISNPFLQRRITNLDAVGVSRYNMIRQDNRRRLLGKQQ